MFALGDKPFQNYRRYPTKISNHETIHDLVMSKGLNAALNVSRQKCQFYKNSIHTYARRQLLRRHPRDPRVGNP